MAPIKLEDNIREKLEARELKPSADAWKKLETQLGAKQPRNKTLLWYYVAASFVGLLILASVFFVRNSGSVDNNKLVEQNTQTQGPEKSVEILPKNVNLEEIASEVKDLEQIDSDKKQKANNKKVNQLPFKKESVVDKQIQKTEAIAKVSKEDVPLPVKKETPIISEKEKLFNLKVDEVVAQVQKLQNSNTEISVEEVDALLKNARRDIDTQRILNNPKVDATALLQDVEWELERGFRDKVFDALGEGFQKVRTAVTERNN